MTCAEKNYAPYKSQPLVGMSKSISRKYAYSGV